MNGPAFASYRGRPQIETNFGNDNIEMMNDELITKGGERHYGGCIMAFALRFNGSRILSREASSLP
jgi:hypothetical protein